MNAKNATQSLQIAMKGKKAKNENIAETQNLQKLRNLQKLQ